MRDLVDFLVRPDDGLREVIESIDRGAAQIALVADAENKLLGVITDGDIRRAMLRGESLTSLAEDIMFRDFRSIPSAATEEEALAIMRCETLHQIPAIDEHGRVVRLFLLEELIKPKKRPNPVVIMAGGEGKRLRPLTQNCPKPMLQIGGKPLLEIILEQCIDAGFQYFYFSVNFLKNQIIDYFGDGERWGVRIDYLEETQPLGTSGALSLLPQKPSEPLLVLNGDVLARVDYGRLLNFHDEHQAAATLCVREYATQIPYGVVEMDGLDVKSLLEKPVLSHYVNLGIYLLDPKLLDLVPHDRFFDMPQLLETAMQHQHRVGAFPIHEYWVDVGRPDTFEEAQANW
ncbi:nucleotidyltransferase family protein [Alphaproteobacteria bacterium]|nr:nucleotidyltransferase family protein [Alphaproteobacteria bacterium]